MNRLSYRRVLSTACLMLAPLIPAWAQQTYQSPPADLVKILEAPANPITSISPNRQWVLVTVSDPRTVTISDMADSAYYLAGSKIRANPDYRIENIGIRSGTVSGIDGKVEHQLEVPAGGRLGSTAWSISGDQLAYTTVSNGGMSVEILNPATGISVTSPRPDYREEFATSIGRVMERIWRSPRRLQRALRSGSPTLATARRDASLRRR